MIPSWEFIVVAMIVALCLYVNPLLSLLVVVTYAVFLLTERIDP